MSCSVSLHRVDPRFVLSHRVRHAVVLDGLQDWAAGLASAGIDVSSRSGGRPDLAVAPARLAAAARGAGARSIILEGSRERSLTEGANGVRRLLLRPSRDRPTLALPLDQPTAV